MPVGLLPAVGVEKYAILFALLMRTILLLAQPVRYMFPSAPAVQSFVPPTEPTKRI